MDVAAAAAADIAAAAAAMGAATVDGTVGTAAALDASIMDDSAVDCEFDGPGHGLRL